MQSHTTPVQDTSNIGQAFQWLNQNMESGSCLLTRDTFVDWAKIHLKKDGTIINYQNKEVSAGLQYAKSLGYMTIYRIWWENGVGLKWYGQPVPEGFKAMHRTGNIVVFKYTGP